MTSNPLARRAANDEPVTRMTRAELQGWCDERNANSATVGEQVWHYVAKERVGAGEIWSAKRVEGYRAREMRLADERRAFKVFNPQSDDADAIHKRVRELIDRGVKPHEFDQMVERGLI